MLVSARADAQVRDEIRRGMRPCPEYLRLEERHGVDLLDWSLLGTGAIARTTRLSLAHTAAALRRLADVDVVFSDGEHLGMPLALAMRALRLSKPHLMLGHHVTSKTKRYIFRTLRPQAKISRLLVHSTRQLKLAMTELGVPRSKLAFVPYGVDPDFWSPRSMAEERLVISVGREHRDYSTLAQACDRLGARVFIAAGSLFSSSARQDSPNAWPDNFEVGFAAPISLRDWYQRASVVVVPLVPNDFQAGVTVILEAMAMAKAVVVTATAGQRDIIENGLTGVLVPPSDPHALRDVIDLLLENANERRRLGANAREAAANRFGLDAYADALAGHLAQIASPPASPELVCPRDGDDHPIYSLGDQN
jgi:glycosyltransferase involved in cell wall biosynthesis